MEEETSSEPRIAQVIAGSEIIQEVPTPSATGSVQHSPPGVTVPPPEALLEVTDNVRQFEESSSPTMTHPKSQFDDADEDKDVIVRCDGVPKQAGSPPLPPSTVASADISGQSEPKREVSLPDFPKLSASEAAAKAAEFREAMAKKKEKKVQPSKRNRKSSPKTSSVVHKKTKASAKESSSEAGRNEYGSSKAQKKSASSKKSNFSTTTPVHDLTPHDVLCGPDLGSYPNAGNQFFRRLIRLRQENFRVAKRKPLLREAVVDFILQIMQRLLPPGRFLGMDAMGKWTELGASETRNFVTAALGEGVTGIVAWQRPVPLTSDDDVEEQEYLSFQSRPYSKKRKLSLQDGRPSVNNERRRQPEVIDIYDDADDDSSVPAAPRRTSTSHARSLPAPSVYQPQLAAHSHSNLLNAGGPEGHQLPDTLGLPSAGLDSHSARAAYEDSHSAQAAYEARLQAAGLHRSALLGGFRGDPSALAYSRMNPVSSLPASLLLGTPPTGHLSSAHPQGGLVMMPGASAQHIDYGGLGTDSLLAANRFLPGAALGRQHFPDADF